MKGQSGGGGELEDEHKNTTRRQGGHCPRKLWGKGGCGLAPPTSPLLTDEHPEWQARSTRTCHKMGKGHLSK